jgi:hypothetical protein
MGSGVVVGWSSKVGQCDSSRYIISPMQTHSQETGVHVRRKFVFLGCIKSFVTSVSDI